jgi:hypothetical protein
MIATEGKKINVEIFGLDSQLTYRAADLNAFFEVDSKTAERLEKLLTSRGIGGERPAGVRIGRHIIVMLSSYLKTYGIVVMASGPDGGYGR